jgi:hypothetical protein
MGLGVVTEIIYMSRAERSVKVSQIFEDKG